MRSIFPPLAGRFGVAAVVYAAALSVVVVAGLIAFHGAEGAPSEGYAWYLGVAGLGLAVYLGIWAAAFGAHRRSVILGLGSLALGVAVTVAALSILPWVTFAQDQYAAPALWLMGALGPMLAAFLVVTVARRVLA